MAKVVLTVGECREVHYALSQLSQTGVELKGLALYDMACNRIVLKPIVDAYTDAAKEKPEYEVFQKALAELQKQHAFIDEKKRFRIVEVDGDRRPLMADESAYAKAETALKKKHVDAIAKHDAMVKACEAVLKKKETVCLQMLPRSAFEDTKGLAGAIELLGMMQPIIELPESEQK